MAGNMQDNFDENGNPIRCSFCGKEQGQVRRLVKGSCTQTENSSLFMQAARDFPEAYQCAYAINRVFEKEFKQSCSDEELLYLMMHINRLRSASQTE
jgi:beta-glucoside operon transcriptional antiterminator